MSNLNVLVHPQAMLVMSNHFTRVKYDDINVHLPAHVGLLLGQAAAARLEVNAAIELLVTGEKGQLKIDQTFIDNAYKDIHKFSFPQDSPIGWYSCEKLNDELRSELTPLIEQLISDYDSQSRLFGEFIYDPKANSGAEFKSPLTLYVSHNLSLEPIEFTYQAEPAERIAMLQLQSEGSAENQTQFTAKAFQSLDHDLELVQKYLEKVIKKEIPFDPEKVRKAATLSLWWNHNSLEDEGFDKVEEQADLALLCGMLLETLTIYEKQTQ